MLKQDIFSYEFIIIVLICLLPAKSISDFYFQNPNRISYNLNSCAVIGSNTLIAVGNHGTIVRVDMAKSTITQISDVTTNDLSGVCFYKNRGWIASGGGKIFFSNDNGLNWKEQRTGILNNLHSVFFIDSLTGWITVQEGILLKSIDAGKTWNKDTTWHSDSIINSPQLSSIVFTDSLQGWILANNNALLYTHDRGAHWSYRKISENDGGGSITGITFNKKSGIGYMSTSNGRVRVTNDNGKTWNNLYINSKCSFDAVLTNDTGLYLFGNSKYYDNNSRVYTYAWRSVDAGVSWNNDWIDTGVYLNGYTELSDGSILAVGAFGTILKWMPNSNKLFKISEGTTHHLSDIHFIDSLKGFAVGGYQSRDSTYDAKGVILSTSDGGKTWIEQSAFTGYRFSSIYFHDSQNGWIFGGDDYRKISQVIFNTSDGGKTWNIQKQGPETFLSCSYFLNKNTGWTAGGRGVIYKTEDGGNNWSQQVSNSDSWIYDIQFYNKDMGWATAGSNLLITKNAGQTWSKIDLPTQQFPLTLFFIDSLNGWIGGPRGCLLRSFDGGNSWISIIDNMLDSLDFNDILFSDTLNGFGVGMVIYSKNGFIANTSDGGKSWNVKMSGIPYSMESLCSYNNTYIWACGKWGTIISNHSSSGANSAVSQSHPASKYLVDNLSVTSIRKSENIRFVLEAPDNSLFRIMIFDIIGKIVWESPVAVSCSSQCIKGPDRLTSGIYIVSTTIKYKGQYHKSIKKLSIP